jgi:selenocysteine lyase/cysteine desulfurase
MEALDSRRDFAALSQSIYLNQAALGLIPVQSIEVMINHLTETAQHGNVRLTDEDELRILDDLHVAGADLLGTEAQSVAVLGGASEGLASAAALMPAGEVVLVSSDFPSVTHPWLAGSASGRSVVWVEDAAGVNLTESLIDAVKPGVAAVCVSAVMYGTGTRVDCAALAAHAHDVGAGLIVDATQLAGAGPVRMADWGADVVVTSGYKWLCGHGGVALLAVSNGLLEAVPPHPGWMGTPSPFDFDATNREQAPGARRFQQSTIAYASALGLTESVTRLNRLGFDKMESHARRLASELIEGVEPLGWRPFRSIDDPSASPHLISLRHPNLDARRVRSMLHQEHGIVTSARLSGIRVSLHCYNDSGDVSALAKALNVIGKAAR